MPESKELRPQEAAKLVLEDIASKPESQGTMRSIMWGGERPPSRIELGAITVQRVYNTKTSGNCESIGDSFQTTIYGPLGITPVVRELLLDFPYIDRFLENLGELVGNRYY
jgi:hypothetical protein